MLRTAGVLCLSLIISSGCAHRSVEKVAIFKPDGEPDSLVKPAPRSGMYRVQLTSGDRYHKTPSYASVRWVQQGEPLGFREDEHGKVVAIAGSEEVALSDLPAGATHLMWYHKSKRPTQVTKSMQKFMDGAEKAMIATGTVAACAGIIALDVWLEAHEDSADDCRVPPKHHHKHH